MQKTVYENYKYSLQDTAKVYIGAKYTFAELLDQDEVAFKFRLIVERYILAEKEVDPQDTLETHLYYLKPDSFLVKIYDRIKARVKINIIEEKKRIFGRGKTRPVPACSWRFPESRHPSPLSPPVSWQLIPGCSIPS